MDTIRFSKIVEAAGKPVVHVLWVDPAKDAVLHKAIKTNRIMTIHQESTGTKTDYGIVGFEKNVPGQILIFPKSLKRFADHRVIGVKYDLLEWPAVPKSKEASLPRPPKHPGKNKLQKTKIAVEANKPSPSKESAVARVVKFPARESDDQNEPNEAVEEIKSQVRHAMKVLEEGKQVAAFNLLKRIVDS
jgi:hypothetical protein